MNPIRKSAQAQRGRDWLLGLLLITATFLAYLPAWHGGFIWDDDAHISSNLTLRSLRGLWEIWFKPGATCQYYPLSFTLFWAEYQLWGLNPLGYHLLNVTLHCLVAVLLWQILERLKVRGAWLAGAIFALHPVCVMSVAWMTELKNTLSAALALGAGWAYLRFAGLGVYDVSESNGDNLKRTDSGIDWRYGILSLILFLLAMFAKTAVSFLPATLLLVAWWQRGRLVWRELVPLLLMLILVVAMGEMTFYIEHLHGAVGTGFSLGFAERVLVSARSFWFYLEKLFFPHSLTFVYERWDVNAAPWWQYLLYPTATIGLFALLWWKRNVIGRGPLVALLHFYISTSLLILIVVLYMTRYTFVSDHWQYFGCMSVIALVAAGITKGLDWLGKKSRFLKPFLVGMLLLVLGLLTWRQCGMYADIKTLWQATLARNPRAFLAYNNLGTILTRKGEVDAAIADLKKALEIAPDFFEAHNNLGNALLQKGRVDEAMDHFRMAVEIAPFSAVSHYNLGNTLLQVGQMDEAMIQFQEALAIQADFPEAQNNLGVALMRSGRLEEAKEHYQAALATSPNYAEAHYNLGCILDREGRLNEAIAHYQKAVEVKPDYADAHYSLGVALGLQGRLNEAAEQYRKVIQLQPGHADAHGNLANVLAAQGRLGEAIPEYRRTLELVPDSAQAHFRFGQALQAQRDYKAAIAEYQRTMELNPRHLSAHLGLAWLLATSPEASLRDGNRAVELTQKAEQLARAESAQSLDTLAAAYAEAGRYREAVETAKRALNLSATQNNQPLAAAIQVRFKLYEAGSPYHEKP
ncbi:MAG: tetratricopeptide repeat protein [Verrucomicrobiota bacterium]